MSNLRTALCIVSVMALPATVAAQEATAAFDGTYTGVSRVLEEGGMATRRTRGCTPSGAAAPLTIANGVARTPWMSGDPLLGSVGAQGTLVMRTQFGQRFDGQIDGEGRVTGRLTGACAYQMTWQKRAR
jgi:hypothetical protein